MQFTCYLIGQGPARAVLEKQIQRLPLGDRVRFVGPRPHDQLPDWFREASVFVLPSRSEGLPTVLLEALATGTPFVASRVGGIPELGHLGQCRLVRPDDPAKLAKAISLTLTETAQTTELVPISAHLRTYEGEAEELTTFLESVRRNHHNSRGESAGSPFPANGVDLSVVNH